jgi:signal transduction histidine kinase/DNA-binding response OmpR family regulator
MTMNREASEEAVNLSQLQADSLRVIALFVASSGYLLTVFIVRPETRYAVQLGAWASGPVLMLSAGASYLLKDRFSHAASSLLLSGMLVAIACLESAFQAADLAYFGVLVVISASVLLGQTAVLWTAGVTGVINTVTSMALGFPLLSHNVLLPLLVLVWVAIACRLSARNLYTALAWVWHGYEQARHNEEMALERGAELRRALKALDEATYRLERANHALALAREQAEEAYRLKQQFSQTISHELRTPLNLIVGFTELMLQSPEYYGGQLPPAYLRDLSIVHRNACHLQNLVDDVLDLARIEAAQMSILMEETDPATLVQDAVNTARSLVESRGLALRVEVEPNLPPIAVDPTRIRQVLFNLLNNATRFTEQGSVAVGVKRQGQQVVFSVADTGVGIASEDIARIFEEFQQVDGTARRRHGGAGLGLAISRGFVELHGGRIWATSQVGQGSTFYFSLPVNEADPFTLRTEHLATLREHPARDNPDECILLAITRSTSATALLTRYLSRCRTVVAHDLEEGRLAAQTLAPQAVVIDMALGELDATKLEQIAQTWGLARTPLLACALPGEEGLRRQLAVAGYLIKPVSRQSLWDVLRQLGENIDKVLIIDDDRDFVRLLTRMLDNPVRRYQVISAYSGYEGLALIEHTHPDLVLLDLVLPDMDGYQFVEHLRTSIKGQRVPIVIVSAQDTGDRPEALAGTMLIAKSDGLMPAEIVRWIQSALDMHRPWSSTGNVRASLPPGLATLPEVSAG